MKNLNKNRIPWFGALWETLLVTIVLFTFSFTTLNAQVDCIPFFEVSCASSNANGVSSVYLQGEGDEINDPNVECSTVLIHDKTDEFSVTLSPGETYEIEVSVQYFAGYWAAAFIYANGGWQLAGSSDETSEFTSGIIPAFNITIPAGLTGVGVLRVLAVSGGVFNTELIWAACGSYGAGSGVDYTVNFAEAQEGCENTFQYPSATVEASADVTEIDDCSFNGDYTEISGVEGGESYEFTAYDDFNDEYSYITVRSGTSAGDLVGSGFSPLTITATSDDNLFIHWNSDESCGTSGSCLVTTVQCTSCVAEFDCPDLEANLGDACVDADGNDGIINENCACVSSGGVECSNTNSYGSANVSTPDTKTISTCQWFREYSTISGVIAGYEYEFAGAENSSGNLAYITVRSGSVDGPVIAAGWSPLTITATSDDNLYVHWNSDADCGTTTNCATTTANCVTCATLEDCEGEVGGSALPGTPCDDGDATTYGDTYTDDCECVGIPYDCIDLLANIGDACDDGDATTVNDTVNADCECVGEPAAPGSVCDSAIPVDCNAEPATYSSSASNGSNTTACFMGDNGLWFSFMGTGTDITINSTASFDHEMSINSGPCDALVNVICIDNFVGAESYTISPSVAGEMYYVYIAHWASESTTTGDITIDIECLEADYDCPDIQANIGDACDDLDASTENDIVGEDCVCAGTPIVVEFDCPEIQANIGDACDDLDASTENDIVGEDCDCAGTPIVVEFDCPDLEANIGDACELADGEPGVLNNDCQCIPATECQTFVYYLSDHAASDGISTIYEVTLDGFGVATMDSITTSDIEIHIAYREQDALLYAISKHNNSYRTLDPILKVWGTEVPFGSDLGEITAAVFNHDGKLLIGSQNQNVIYSVNVITDAVSTYDTYSPINGGDFAFASDGMLFMATRSGNGLYKVWTNPTPDDLIGSVPAKVTGMAITPEDQLLISAQGQTSLVMRDMNGSDPGTTYTLEYNGAPYTLRDGDMASGCADNRIIEYCDDFSTYYINHGDGIIGSHLYKVNYDYGAGEANLVALDTVPYEAHIAFNAQQNLVYLMHVDGSGIDVYNPITDNLDPYALTIDDSFISGSLSKVTAVMYNHADGLLYIGDHYLDKIYTVNLSTGVATYYADGPVSGGDLEMLDNGDIYLATREGAALYKVNAGATATFVGNIPSTVNGLARANDIDNSFVVANKDAMVFTQVRASNGSTMRTFNIIFAGAPFTSLDGDLASGCADDVETGPQVVGAVEALGATSKLTSYPNPTNGLSKVVFVTGETTRTLVEVYDMNGRNVATLFNQEAQKGEEYTLDFNGSKLSNGVYIYRLTTQKETIIEKFMIAR